MHITPLGIALLGLVDSAVALPRFPSLQNLWKKRDNTTYTFAPQGYRVNYDRANAVKAAFDRSWSGYYKYAFPHDSLKPVTNGWQDDRNGWGASAVDALSTALVMGNTETINQILEFIPTINFDNTTTDVSLFETTIRYLGGMLAGYDLLKGPLSQYARNVTQVEALLKQAQHLADNLKVAFDTPTGIPDNGITFLPTPHTDNDTQNGLATIGTLVLEWTRLSDLTGIKEYGELAQKGESYLLDPKPLSDEPFPGLLGDTVWLSNGTFADASGSWNGGTDSFYEYLIKMYVYDPTRFAKYKDRWVLAADSTMEYIVSHPTTRPDLTFLAYWSDRTLYFEGGHLGCFAGGNLILGGLVLREPKYVELGLAVTAGCHDTYVETTTGIGPEIFQWQDNRTPLNASNNPGPPADQADFYKRAGFWILNGQYVLRPEVLESFYYAYRATGDPIYQEWSWNAFLAINKTCAVGSGFSDITDVNPAVPGNITYTDTQETFWFAEVMKYSYLIQAEDSPFQVQVHNQEFVFNTEAHPLRVAGF